MLEIDGIDVYYGPVQALREVTLTVAEGEMVALLGANGAGKTTTLRTVSGLLAPKRGSIRLAGQDIAGRAAHHVVGLGVGQLPQGRELFGELTVMENLKLGHWSRRKSRKHHNQQLDYVMELFPKLDERRNQAAATMSGGEQQMLAMARALMAQPKVLLLDEPSMGLAPVLVDSIFDTIRQLHATGTTILLVEQNARMALQVADRGYVMQTGEVVLSDRADSLRENASVQKAYLGVT